MKLPAATTSRNCEQTDRQSSIQLTLFFIQSINKLTLHVAIFSNILYG